MKFLKRYVKHTDLKLNYWLYTGLMLSLHLSEEISVISRRQTEKKWYFLQSIVTAQIFRLNKGNDINFLSEQLRLFFLHQALKRLYSTCYHGILSFSVQFHKMSTVASYSDN